MSKSIWSKRRCAIRGKPGAWMAVAILAGVVLNSMPVGAGDGEFSLTIAFDYAVGDYGTAEDTEVIVVPVSARYVRGPWTFRLTVPYLMIDGPGTVIGGGDDAIVTGRDLGVARREEGLGDVVAAVSYLVNPRSGLVPFIELTGKLKLPTAPDDRGLGTGKVDFISQVEAFQSLGRFVPFVSVGYRVLGDPSGFDLDNGFFASIGGSYNVRDDVAIGTALDWRQAASPLADGALEVQPYLTFRLPQKIGLTVHGVVGVKDGSPDGGGGVQLRKTF